MIYTKRHEILDMFRHNDPAEGSDRQLYYMVQDIFESRTLPHYVLTEDLMKSLDPDAVSQTCTAMCQAGVARMPHEEMLVETKCGGLTLFTLFREEKGDVKSVLLTYDGMHVEIIPHAMCISLQEDGMLVMRGAPSKVIGDRVGATYLIALVLSHTRGLAKEVVTESSMRQFNKARAKKKRAPVFDHTVLRVGRVYCKHGTASKYTEGGAMRRPHLRKGHARKQKYGPNWSQERWIFVPACFINWVEGDEVPVFKPKVVTP